MQQFYKTNKPNKFFILNFTKNLKIQILNKFFLQKVGMAANFGASLSGFSRVWIILVWLAKTEISYKQDYIDLKEKFWSRLS